MSKNFKLQAACIPQFILPAENALGSDFLEILVFLFKKKKNSTEIVGNSFFVQCWSVLGAGGSSSVV